MSENDSAMSVDTTMMISNSPSRPNSRDLRFSLASAMLLIVPLGLAFLAGSTYLENGSKVPLDERQAASQHLQELFTATGPANLCELTDVRDSMVALHASWELAKGDSKKADRFVDQLKKRLNVDPPKWWRESVKNIRVYKDNCHYVPDVDSSKLQEASRLVHDRFEIIADPDTAGFPFQLSARERNTKKQLWTVEVWAVGRFILGGVGVHRIEIVASDDCLFVFGTESHGAYVEAFRLANGKPIMRFSTCYWFNFSERWKL